MAENYGSLTGTLDAHDTLEGNLDNHGEMSGEIQFGSVSSKVDDVLVNEESVVENKIAHIDLTPYAEIENVYDKTTIDTALQGKADTEDIPTDLSELQDDASHRTVTDAEKTEWSGKADTSDIPTALSQLTNDDNYVQDEHYQHTDNNYTDNEKSKLADIESGAEANVQSDWNESDTSSDAYILNKPTIPSVVANPQNTTATLTSIGIDGTNYAVQGGGGGGAVNSVNGKTGDVVLDAEDVGALPDDTPLFSGDYNDLTNKPTIPDDLADLNDDSTHRLVTDTEKNTWDNKSDFSGSYNDLTDKPTIPDAQIQSDWNQSDNTKVDFIKNKPTLGTAAAKDSTNAVTQNSTDLVESGAVWSAIDNLPEPMVFKGTLGVNGTIASLPTASSSNNGYTYKVITDGTYDGKSAKVGDVFTSNATEWVLIPSGDETFTDTWRSVKVDGTELLGSSITTGAVNFKSGTNVTVSGNGNDITISATDTTYSKATAQADGLMSKEDFGKLSGVETGAQVNVQSDWNQANTSADDYIKNKPTLGTASALNVASSGDASTTEVVKGDDSRLSDARTPVSHTHTTSDITDFPTMSDYIQKSNTSGLVKNDGTIDTNSYATTSQIPDISGKADKVSGATNGNLAGLNASGNLTDSTWSADKTTTQATGNPVSIPNLKSNQLAINPIITLEPIQAGSGTPSPSNVRAISGYDTVTIVSANGSDPTAQGYVIATEISEALGQTVYWGRWKPRTGEFEVVGGRVYLPDLLWEQYQSNLWISYSLNDLVSTAIYPKILPPDTNNDVVEAVCEKYQTDDVVTLMANQTTNIRIGANAVGTMFFATGNGSENTPTGYMAYKLLEPFTIQLTPHEISLLKDYAYVSTNGTNIALDYHNGEMASLSDVSQLGETVNELSEYAYKVNIPSTVFNFISANILAWTGCSIVIPTNSLFELHVHLVYVNNAPLQLVISASHDAANPYLLYYNSEVANGSISGRTFDSPLNLYIWARHDGAGNNFLTYDGWYSPIK